MHSFYKMIHVI